jgi:hypothetical protein
MGLVVANEREVERPIQLQDRAASVAWSHAAAPRLRPDHAGVLTIRRGVGDQAPVPRDTADAVVTVNRYEVIWRTAWG